METCILLFFFFLSFLDPGFPLYIEPIVPVNANCTAEPPLRVSFFHDPRPGFPTDQRNGDKEFVIRRAATNRVLNVLRHWVSKHPQVSIVPFVSVGCPNPTVNPPLSWKHSAVGSQDFELNTELKLRVIGFLEEVMHDPELLTQERKAAANIIRLVG